MLKIFLPYMEVPWKRIPAPLEKIASAGFNGVECTLIGKLRTLENVRKLHKRAVDLNLEIHLHQGWSKKTGQPNLFNVFLGLAGVLVPIGASLEKQVDGYGNVPVVIYGNLIKEPSFSIKRYQTASEHKDGRYAMPFNEFAEIVLRENLPVVFDTQHILEWLLNVQGVEGLPTDPQTIYNLIAELWEKFRPLVAEIHLNDFNPHLGRSRGRNVFPGDGIFPLKKFCDLVRESKWDGVVVPEVAPQHLSGVHQLRALRDKISQLFKG